MPSLFKFLAAALALVSAGAAAQDSAADPSFGGLTRFTEPSDARLACPAPATTRFSCRFAASSVEGLAVESSDIRFAYDTLLDMDFVVPEEFSVVRSKLVARFGAPQNEENGPPYGRSAAWTYGVDPVEAKETFWIAPDEKRPGTHTVIHVFFNDDRGDGCVELSTIGASERRC